MRILAKQEEILFVLAAKSQKENFDYSLVYPEFNETALLYATFGEFEKAFALVELNFDHLQKFVERNVFVERRSDAEDAKARKLYSELPGDLTFSRQEMREKILFLKEGWCSFWCHFECSEIAIRILSAAHYKNPETRTYNSTARWCSDFLQFA